MQNFGNSVDWWTTTKASPAIFRPSHLTVEIETYLRSAIGIDPAIIAAELKLPGLGENRVRSWQRQLGLRPCAPNNGAVKQRYALDHRGRNRDA
jgi:hypothetical protein